MVKEVNKSESHPYIKQAEEFLELAKKDLKEDFTTLLVSMLFKQS